MNHRVTTVSPTGRTERTRKPCRRRASSILGLGSMGGAGALEVALEVSNNVQMETPRHSTAGSTVGSTEV